MGRRDTTALIELLDRDPVANIFTRSQVNIHKSAVPDGFAHIVGLDGNEGLLVASKIADRSGITRSVIVNALRKLESAGVIESKSLGMKGTRIKIINTKLKDELKVNW